MTGSEQRDDTADPAPKPPVKRVTGVGLSPAVERMFGVLVDEQSTAGTQSTAEPEARRASQPGAA